MKWFKYITIAAAILVFGAGIGTCLWLAGSKTITNSESVFLGAFLSLLSILASWLVSHIYAELSVQAAREDARANLRTYALKAAEKVTNLSNELGKLAAYLQAELNDTSYDTSDTNLQGKNERIQSAIHLLQTLKSVNDGSLSDWEGVIGDELKNQRERDEEQEAELTELAERIDHLSAAIDGHDSKEAIEELRHEMRNVMMYFGGRTILATPPKLRPNKAKEQVKISCPTCKKEIHYKQWPKPKSFKLVECPACNGKFVSHFDAAKTAFALEPRRAVTEQINCPYCEAPNQIALDNLPGTAITAHCGTCHLRIRLARSTITDVKIMKLANELAKMPSEPLTDEIITTVQRALPAQPWPPNIHQKIAVDLNISAATVRNATAKLIQRGTFLHQYNGKLFIEAPPSGRNGETSDPSSADAIDNSSF